MVYQSIHTFNWSSGISWRLLHHPTGPIGHQGAGGDGQLHTDGEAHEEVHY